MEAIEKCVIVCAALIFSVINGLNGECYKFTGNGRVIFEQNADIGPSASFKLKFKTTANDGLLYYAEGLYHPDRVYDYEGLFLLDGYLYYFLFNPAPFSIGSTFGFRGKSKERVNNATWITAEFYRNIRVEVISPNGDRETVYQTGLKVGGEVQASDNGERIGVEIKPPIILGEDPHIADRPSKKIVSFEGKIKDFQETTRNIPFDLNPRLTGDVSRCITGPDAV